MNLSVAGCFINESIFRRGMSIYRLVWNNIINPFGNACIFNLENCILLSFVRSIILNFLIFLKANRFFSLITLIKVVFWISMHLYSATPHNIFPFFLWSASSIILCIYSNAIKDFSHSFLSLIMASFPSLLYAALLQKQEIRIYYLLYRSFHEEN